MRSAERASLFLSSVHQDALDLLTSQLGLEFVAGVRAELGRVGLINREVAVTMQSGHGVKLATNTDLEVANAKTYNVDLQERLLKGGEVQPLAALLLAADVAAAEHVNGF